MAVIDRRGVSVDATDTIIAGNPNPGLAVKAPALVATTGNIVLSGLQTIDGVALAAGNRVLVWQQTNPAQNGLYNASTGPWTRTLDLKGNDAIAAGLQIVVTSGSTYLRTTFQMISPDPVTLGTSAVNFAILSVASARRINTTAPLAGGGDLSADRTLLINPSGITYGLIQQVATASLVGNPTGLLATAQAIALGATLAFSGTSLQTGAGSGDVSWSANSFVTSIGANKVTNAMIRQGAGLSVVGVAGSAAANVADIVGAANQVLVVNAGGTALGFGTVAYAGLQPVSASRLLGNPTGAGASASEISLGATLTFSGAALQTLALSGDVAAAANSFATTIQPNAVTYAKFQQVAASSLVGNATAGLANATGITLGATFAFSGSALQTTALSGDVTTSANSFATTITAGAVTNAKLATMAAFTLKGNATGAAASATDISIPALTQKVTPVAGDILLLVDSAASNALKYATVGSVNSAGLSTTYPLSGTSALSFVGPTSSGHLEYVSATSIKFFAVNGDTIRIGGVVRQIPSGGIDSGNPAGGVFLNGVAASTLALNTSYFVYCFNNAGALALDFSTTSYVQDSTAGNVGTYIKSGDSTRSLVGMCRIPGAVNFINSASQRFVISWFNRVPLALNGVYTANRSITNQPAFVEVNTEIRCEFLTFTADAVSFAVSANVFNTAVGDTSWVSIGFDGATAEDTGGIINGTTATGSIAAAITKSGLADGYHYATVLATINTANTLTILGSATAGKRTNLSGRING